jgi:hypothetical protein
VLLSVLGGVLVTEECTSSPEVRWTALDDGELARLIVGPGGYLVRTQDVDHARRLPGVSRGFPLDRSSTPLMELVPSGMGGGASVRLGRLFLYEAGDRSLRSQFAAVQRRLRALSVSVPHSMGARIFPHAREEAELLGSAIGTRTSDNPFRRAAPG